MGIDALLMSARRGDRGIMRYARRAWRGVLGLRLPVFRPLFGLLYAEWNLRQTYGPLVLKFLYREPLLRYRCERVGARLQLGGSLPMIIGDGRIEIGDDVGIDTRNTWLVGFKVSESAELIIGDRVFIGYQNVLSVARSIRIGDDTMLAGNVKIFDNISHPLSPARRLRHDSFTLDECAPVVIGRNVWIGDGAVIMRGVTIGDNSVVAASSVVTRSVPPNTLVAGNPAVVKKEIGDE
jgi:acetyltransferase-like isoleucine patch superfamily enzyme